MQLERFFNTAGPCEPGRHYMIPPLDRLPGTDLLVERGQYFALHAPRQSGKTTFLRALAQQLRDSGRYVALHFSCETGESGGDDAVLAQVLALGSMHQAARAQLPAHQRPPKLDLSGLEQVNALSRVLEAWAQQQSLPVVLFIDEIDALRGPSLVSVLRQLRAGYNDRGPGRFPWSVALCGLRDVRDYKLASGGDPERLGTSSPFNIKVESLRLFDFDRESISALLGQYTADTGQLFTQEAIDTTNELSGGQPWLVNALAREVVEKLKLPRDVPITAQHIDIAKERIILARQTHLDSLVARLREPRVRRVLEPLVAGTSPPTDPTYNDDVAYVRALGLIARTDPVEPANAIYREMIMRVLAETASAMIPKARRSFVSADGSLDMHAVLDEFAKFWRQHGEALQPSMPYHEVACELILSAWLQRVINGGGHIERQYALGNRRMDVLVRWPPRGDLLAPLPEWQREALELKVWRSGEPDPLQKGLEQLEEYLDHLGLKEGWLVIFDRRDDRAPTAERTQFETAITPNRRYPVNVLRA